MITNDTLNEMKFQLTAGVTLAKNRSSTVTIDAALVKTVASAVLAGEPKYDTSTMGTVPDEIRKKCLTILASAERSLENNVLRITLEDVLVELQQRRVRTYVEKRMQVGTMMGLT